MMIVMHYYLESGVTIAFFFNKFVVEVDHCCLIESFDLVELLLR